MEIQKNQIKEKLVKIQEIEVPKGKAIQNKKDPTIFALNTLYLPEEANVSDWQIVDKESLPKQKEPPVDTIEKTVAVKPKKKITKVKEVRKVKETLWTRIKKSFKRN